MKTKTLTGREHLKDAVELIPENDIDIIHLARIEKKVDTNRCNLKVVNGHVIHFYITLEELVRVAVFS